MLFSLVMPTLNRPAEVARFVIALDLQTYRNFELIVVDQNADDQISAILARYAGKFAINHIRVGKPIGAVNARNLGAAAMNGDVLAFPDDDCWYDPDLLDRVHSWLRDNPTLDGVTGRVSGERYYSKCSAPVTKNRVWWQGLEFSLFFRRRIVDRIGLMDPTFGPGAGTPWGAGEAADYILRAVEAGFDVQYDCNIEIHHPGAIDKRDDFAEAKCILKYSAGKGRLLYQHEYPIWYVVYMMARPLVGGAIKLARLQPTKAWISLMVPIGVAKGYLMTAFESKSEIEASEMMPSA